MKKMSESVGAWIRGMVWTAMIFGCAWASAQSYLVQPAGGRYQPVSMSAGEGVGVGQGTGVEGAQNDAATKDDLFAGTDVFAKNATNVTEINMDPDSLNLVGGSDEHKARRMVLNVVRTYEYDKPGMYNMADVDRFREKLNTGDWHCSIHTRDLKTGESTDVCSKHRTDGLKETAIISVEPKELTFIHTIRRVGPGESELGFFPIVTGAGPTAMMAMMDPDAFAAMQMGLHSLPMMMPEVQMQIQKLNSPEMKEQMDRLNQQMKELKIHPPIDSEQMKQLQEQMKEFEKNFDKDKSATPSPKLPE